MLSSLARFGDDAAGIEKSLRLVQGFCTLVVGFCESSLTAAPWLQARHELALGRRYFRILNWWPCWRDAYRTLHGDMTTSPVRMLEIFKMSVLGMYYFLEMPTITNTMGATDYAWGPTLVLEANKCWFYSISISILIGIYQLFASLTASSPAVSKQKSTTKDVPNEKTTTDESTIHSTTNQDTFRQLIVDACDLVIAGSSVGWVAADEKQVGMAYLISTAIAGKQLWDRVQSTGS